MKAGVLVGIWPNKPPGAQQLLVLIRGLIDSGAPIGLSDDAEEFLVRNDLDMSDIKRGFHSGSLSGQPKAGDNEDEWIAKIVAPLVRFPKKKRWIGIVTVVIGADGLDVGRVQWENQT